MPTLIELEMPAGPPGRHTVDLDTLTPKARCLAEAIAQTPLRRIRTRSVQPARQVWAPGHAESIYGPDSPRLDQPEGSHFDGWWSATPARDRLSIAQLLEYESRKFPGWVPVADDGSDLPSTADAAADDGITREQVFEILHRHGVPVDVDTWMRHATKGTGGFPRPARHNGLVSLWSQAEVEAWATRVGAVADVGGQRLAARAAATRASKALRPMVLDLIDRGFDETVAARIAGVDRQVVRQWVGK